MDRVHHGRCMAALTFALAIVASSAVCAGGASTLRLADVLARAQEANPEIEVVRQRAAAMRAVPAQVSAWDDPTVRWEAWDIPDSWQVDQAGTNIFWLGQKVPWPGKRTAAGRVAEHEADAVAHDLRTVRLDLATMVTRAYYDLWLADEQRDILARDTSVIERIARTIEQKYAVGTATQADALRIQVELTHRTTETATAALAIETAAAELNALLSQPPDTPLGVPENPPMLAPRASLETLTAAALDQRPELAAQRAAVASERSGVELARLSRRPDFEFSVGRFVNYQRNDGFGAMAQVNVPLVYGAKYDAAVSEAGAKLVAAEAELRRRQDRVRREVAQAYVRVRTAALQHDLARATHVPQAEQALHVTEAAYQAGTTDFVSLLDALRNIETIHLQHAAAMAELGKATADLERAIGGELPMGTDK
jgi:cobalt-zinc-cadmium efflux system outer membrane protein